MIFSKCHPRTAYNRLRLLKNDGYLLVHTSKDLKHKIWQLDRRGFNSIKEDILFLNEEGFKSESPFHDHKAGVIQLGVFDLISNKNVSVVTEQELRRFDPKSFPNGIPKVGHRSDGYWILKTENNDSKIISLEIELSKKTNNQYSDIAMFYDLEEQVDLIIWVVNSTAFANRIYSQIQTTSDENKNKHIFILFQDFVNDVFNTQVFLGPHKGTYLLEILCDLGAKQVSPSVCQGLTQALASTNIKRCY
ncbi:MAG: hypothetical protein HRT44_11465 [Bdellovibrionales bacterium]|nr:hypothetical protein [Bdellovibrionales bacterium]